MTIRREDARLLNGQSRFTSDVNRPGQAHAVFVRSDRAHARIRSIDTCAALAMPGVLRIMTAQDTVAAAPFWVLASGEGVVSPLRTPARPLLATDRVRFTGEAIALVVADTEARARDAAERIDIAFEELASVTDPVAAAAQGAPLVCDDVPGNLCYAQAHGDAAAVDAALATAAHVVRLRLVNNRVVPSPLEPRAVVAMYEEGSYRVAMPTQGMPRMQGELADLLGVSRENVRIDTADVGGAFGVRTPAYPEYAVLLLAARAVARPIKWTATRSETFLSENHARDGVLDGVLGLDRDGRFVAMRFLFTTTMGAYLTYKSVFIAATNPASVLSGVYRTPAIHARIDCVLTNTAVIGPYRGSGRPEVALMIERLVDEAADRTGIDRIVLRRLNMIATTPHTTATGVRYDSGDFVANMERALSAGDWNGFGVRRAAAKARGRLRGIGLCSFVETSGGPAEEHAALRFTRDGLELHCGTQSAGQGHETVFPRIVAGWLGLAEDRVRLVQGDHALGVESGGAIASRSLVAAGGALKRGADAVIAKAKSQAARALEAAESDIVFCDGALRVAGTDRGITLPDLIERLQCGPQAHPLDCDATVRLGRTFPCGCHVAEVEVDPQTGLVTVVGYTAVDDVGAIQHEGIVEGQIHGGVAQGLGQALLEHCRYDAASGQLLSGSFLDYALPRADDLPPVAVIANTTYSPDHPFGAKGAGESGATGAPGAVMNAIADALRPLGAAQVDMPATPENVWRALSRTATR